jgi:hypothetical protein
MGSTVCTHFLDLAIAAQLSVTAALVCFTWTVADQLYSFNSHGPRFSSGLGTDRLPFRDSEFKVRIGRTVGGGRIKMEVDRMDYPRCVSRACLEL